MRKSFVSAALGAVALAALSGCASGDDSSGPRPGGTLLPCDVEAVLQARCQACHAATPVNGAPIPLVSYSDTQTVYLGQVVWRRMKAAVESGIMPQGSRLSATEHDTLSRWFDSGAPGANAGCTGSGG
jgi:uncharacterized membrane protein